MKSFNIKSVALKASLKGKFVPALLLVLCSFAITTAASAANIVVNGGFEEPIVEDRWMTYHGDGYDGGQDCPDNSSTHCNDGTTVPGWSVFWTDLLHLNASNVEGRLELQRGLVGGSNAHDGSQKAELDSHHRMDSNNNNVSIGQLLPTCPLSVYTLQYAWKSRTEDSGDNDVQVLIADNIVNTHMQNDAWDTENIDFLSPDADETLLAFVSTGTESTKGMFLDHVSVIGPDGSNPENCSLVCDNKPKTLTLRYDGDEDSNHDQSGNEVIIFPETGVVFPNQVRIEVYNHKKKNPTMIDAFTVNIGETFDVTGSKQRIPPRLTFVISTTDDEHLQTVQFHTSCSQPLNAGDEFGAITVWDAVN